MSMFVGLAVTLAAGPLEIVDNQGRKIDAEILSGNADAVIVKKPDGKEHRLAVKFLSAASRDAIAEELAKIEAAKPKGIVVSSVIIKRIKATSLGGTFRYFFDIRNFGPEPFAGSIEITLNNSQKGVTNGKDIFTTTKPIEVRLGTAQFIDAYTGPREVHGDASVSGYTWKVVVDGKQVGSGSGDISAKYEDLIRE